MPSPRATATSAAPNVPAFAAQEAVIGHGAVINLLSRALESGRLAHAYLFAGPDGVGKATVARAFAASLLNTDRLDAHPDFFFLERSADAKTGAPHRDIVIEQVRELRQRLSMGAMMRGWKVAIVADAQRLNIAAANALLKALEEPHPRTLLLLLADAENAVLPTIRSRCQVVRFARVGIAEVASALEARGVAAGDADVYARLSGGRPGLALRYAEHPEELGGMRELRETILAMPGQAVAERWKALDGALPKKASFAELGIAAAAFLDLTAELLRDATLLHADADAALTHVDARAALERWAQASGPERLLAAHRSLADARGRMARNVGPRGALEQFVLAL